MNDRPMQLARHGNPIQHAIVRALISELNGAGFVTHGVHVQGHHPPGKCDAVRADLILRAVFDIYVAPAITLHFASKAKPKDWDYGVLLIPGNYPEGFISDWHTDDKGFSTAVQRVVDLCDPNGGVGYWTLSRNP
jgi:hypothetical protein